MPSQDTDNAYNTRDVQHFEHWSHTYESSWMQRRLFTRIHAAVLDLAASFPPPTSCSMSAVARGDCCAPPRSAGRPRNSLC